MNREFVTLVAPPRSDGRACYCMRYDIDLDTWIEDVCRPIQNITAGGIGIAPGGCEVSAFTFSRMLSSITDAYEKLVTRVWEDSADTMSKLGYGDLNTFMKCVPDYIYDVEEFHQLNGVTEEEVTTVPFLRKDDYIVFWSNSWRSTNCEINLSNYMLAGSCFGHDVFYSVDMQFENSRGYLQQIEILQKLLSRLIVPDTEQRRYIWALQCINR